MGEATRADKQRPPPQFFTAAQRFLDDSEIYTGGQHPTFPFGSFRPSGLGISGRFPFRIKSPAIWARRGSHTLDDGSRDAEFLCCLGDSDKPGKYSRPRWISRAQLANWKVATRDRQG